MSPKDALEILKKDWDSLSNFPKFCYVVCAFLLVATWLFKGNTYSTKVHHHHAYVMHGMFHNIQSTTYFLFIVFLLVLPLGYFLIIWLKILYYRRVYPLDKLGEDYHFQNIEGAVHLFDRKKKLIRWVETSKTAYDLGYYQSMWAETIQRKNYIMSGAKGMNLDEYQLGRGIRTRGKPGD